MLKYILLLFLPVSLFGQNDLALGQWKSYLPYRKAVDVTQSTDRIFYATEWSVLAIDKEDFAAEFLSKVNKLSNVGISSIKYNPLSEILIIVYTDGVIDLLKPEERVSLNAIKNFRNIIGEKRINNVFVENDSMVYLAANYGISRLNILADEFAYTTFTGVEIADVVRFQNQIFVATNEGIYFTSIENPFPEDFSSWERLDQTEGFPEEYVTRQFGVFEDRLFLDIDDALFYYDGQNLTPFL